MEMNFNFSPACVAEVRQLLHKSFIVLLGRIEVGVIEPLPISVSECIESSRIFVAPGLEPFLLNISGSISSQKSGHAARLEMISDCDDEMHHAARSLARHSLPGIAGQTVGCVPQLAQKWIAH